MQVLSRLTAGRRATAAADADAGTRSPAPARQRSRHRSASGRCRISHSGSATRCSSVTSTAPSVKASASCCTRTSRRCSKCCTSGGPRRLRSSSRTTTTSRRLDDRAAAAFLVAGLEVRLPGTLIAKQSCSRRRDSRAPKRSGGLDQHAALVLDLESRARRRAAPRRTLSRSDEHVSPRLDLAIKLRRAGSARAGRARFTTSRGGAAISSSHTRNKLLAQALERLPTGDSVLRVYLLVPPRTRAARTRCRATS